MNTSTHAATLAAFAAILLAGCATTPVYLPDDPTFEERLQHARILLDTGQHRAALRAFADVRDRCDDPALRQRAMLGVSAALRASNDTPAAIGALMPLPLAAATETDARHYAMAGELYLRQKAYETAATYLETALAYKTSDGKWRATALFNLGKCALALGVPQKARDLFTEAQPVFETAGDTASARRCASILADLNTVLPSKREETPDVQ